MTQYLELTLGRLAYDDTGTGPLAVCVPGMGDLRQTYRHLTPPVVAAGYRCVTLDVRGHGESSVSWPDYSVAAIGADVIALVRSLNGGRAVLIGNSMAAGAAVCAAAEAPDHVAGLILLDPFVRDTAPAWQMRLLAAALTGPWGAGLWAAYYGGQFPSAPPADLAGYQRTLRAILRQPGRLRALRRMITASKCASEERLARVAPMGLPVLVLMGTRDKDFRDPAHEAELVAGRLHGTVRMVAGVGHYPQAEIPEVVAGVVTDFLRTAIPAPRGEQHGA